jgi:Fe2+ transport system protein FeoA
MSLTTVENGKRCVVSRIEGENGEREHLLGLGLVPGVPLRKIQGCGKGTVLVEVLGSRVMIAHGLAAKVVVA